MHTRVETALSAIESLPKDVLVNIFSFLNLTDFPLLLLVSHKLNTLAKANLIWKKKFVEYFPHRVAQVSTDNWYDAFRQVYSETYKDLSLVEKKILSCMIEGNIKKLTEYASIDEIKNFIFKHLNLVSEAMEKDKLQGVLDEIYNHLTRRYRFFFRADKLSWAAACNQVNEIKQLTVTKDNGVNEYGFYDHTPLYFAANNGHEKAVAALFAGGARNETGNVDNYTALHAAAAHGHTNVIEQFIANQIDLDCSQAGIANRPNPRPLYIAIKHRKIAAVKLLLENKASLRFIDRETDMGPLHLAAYIGDLDILNLLIHHKGNIKEKNDQDYRPLHFAAAKGHLKVVQALLDRKALVNKTTICGESALYFACKEGHYEVAEVLIKHGAVVDQLYGNPLSAAAYEGHAAIVNLLLENNANPNVNERIHYHNSVMGPPLHLAASKGHLDIMEMLVKKGAEINTPYEGSSPLFEAVLNGHTAAVNFLVEKGAYDSSCDRREKDAKGIWVHYSSALHAAVYKGYADIVALLAKDRNILKPCDIHMAVEQGHYDVVKFFLEQFPSIDTEIKNQAGRTIFAIAKNNKNEAMCQLISKYRLKQYISSRSASPKYLKTFSIFGHTFNFGYTKERKLLAAQALLDVIENKPTSSIKEYENKELNNGKLKNIFKEFKL